MIEVVTEAERIVCPGPPSPGPCILIGPPPHDMQESRRDREGFPDSYSLLLLTTSPQETPMEVDTLAPVWLPAELEDEILSWAAIIVPSDALSLTLVSRRVHNV